MRWDGEEEKMKLMRLAKRSKSQREKQSLMIIKIQSQWRGSGGSKYISGTQTEKAH
jgi:hypothetical protein